mmetsp:Transcript_66020/g.166424  ORF Transcript_66020/g.166424 Transcript_66020/m.166424 type:complete len:219 (+) Transcript_66020:2335-2991(+)
MPSASSSSANPQSPVFCALFFFFFGLALERLLPPSINRASSSMLFSSCSIWSLPFAGPFSSERQMTHSSGMAPGLSKAEQSNELASQMSRKTSMQIHQRLRTNFCPLCLGSSTTSEMIWRMHRPRSIRMNSRCLVSGFTRTGPEATCNGGCLEASPGKDNNSNSMCSPEQTTDSPSRPRTSTPTWICSGNLPSETKLSVNSELEYLGLPLSRLAKVMM